MEELQQDLTRSLETLEQRISRSILETEGVQKPSILFLGSAGVGKSTLITGLAGGRLQALENNLGILVLHGNLNRDVVIGHRVVDGTSIPGAFYHQRRQVILWDCPGFGDPRGVLKEILNAASIARILQVSPRIKLVIVLSEDDVLHPRGGNVRLLFEQLASIFPDIQQLNAITSLVITHHIDRRRPVQALRDLLDDRVAVSEKGKRILRFLLEHENKIAYVAKPVIEGDYELNHEAIWASIGSGEDARQVQAAFSLPLEAIRYLENLAAAWNQEIIAQLRTHQSSIEQAFNTAVLNFSGDSNGLRQSLREFLGSFTDFMRVSALDLPSRDDVRVFERIPGLSQDVLVSLSRKMDQIESLKLIAGPVARGVRFSARDWLSTLHSTQFALDRMRGCLERPVRTQQTLARGGVEHREFFRLPGGSEKVTLMSLPALLTLNYTHQDDLLVSVPREQYTIQSEDYSGTVLQGEPHPPVAYVHQRMLVTPIEGTLSVAQRTVSLWVVKEYLRIDQSQYRKEDRLDGHLVSCSHHNYQHNDPRHESQHFVQCAAEYERTRVDLGVHPQGVQAHARVVGSRQEAQTIGSVYVEIRSSVPVTYVRPDGTQYVEHERHETERCRIRQETREIQSRQYVEQRACPKVTKPYFLNKIVFHYAVDYRITVFDVQERKVIDRAEGLIVVEDWQSTGNTTKKEELVKAMYQTRREIIRPG